MKKLFFFSSLALTLCTTSVMAQSSVPAKTSYGTAFTQGNVYSPGRLPWLMKEKKSLDKMQMVGYISEVCQKEGCWIKMTTEKTSHDELLVKMKDHAFVLPKDIAGKRVMVSGSLVKKTQTVAEQQHYLEDAGASKEEIAAITAPKEVYEMQATGVNVYEN